MSLSAVITAAAPKQRHLLHQTLARAEGRLDTLARFALELLMPEGREPLVDRLAFIIPAGDSKRFAELTGAAGRRVELIEQPEPRGYVDAIYQARSFVGNDPFLHLVGDHFYLAHEGEAWQLADQLIATHREENTSVVAVQPTREALLPAFGAVGGTPISTAAGRALYQVDTVIEKPTPTEAEQRLVVSGLRAGHYLCFFGMHLFTPSLFQLLDEAYARQAVPRSLSEALHQLAQRERVLATILPGSRFDLGARYGILQAQLALALSGPDREEVLTMLVELLAR
ncbi:MAG: sugar phosphate nucleotidyltransferase [Bryobacter sp.]|nr:sugar phosphate nucleotidyltransferase [Bryobacter sp.]